MRFDEISVDTATLDYAIEHGIINVELIEHEVMMRKRKEILENHKYRVYQGRDGYWYTYVPKADGRKKLKSKSLEELEDKIVDSYKSTMENPTVNDIFYTWAKDKLNREEIEMSTYNRYVLDYNRYFSEVDDYKVGWFNEDRIEDFVKDSIHEHTMTAKQFANFRTLCYGIFKYARRKKYIRFSIVETFSNMDISRKSFKRNVKNPEEQVYLPDEKELVESYLMEHLDIVNVGLLLIFKTGVRVGELSAIEKADVKDYIVNICRTETKFTDEHGKAHYDVRDFPKTEAGIRRLIIPHKYEWILDLAFKLSGDGKYLFERDGKRVKTYVFRRRLRYICEDILKIPVKSPHKIRKTVGTILLDSNVKESTIVSMMGHTDISCTKGYYYYDRSRIEEKRNELDAVAYL